MEKSKGNLKMFKSSPGRQQKENRNIKHREQTNIKKLSGRVKF